MTIDEIRRMPAGLGLLTYRNRRPALLELDGWIDRKDARTITAGKKQLESEQQTFFAPPPVTARDFGGDTAVSDLESDFNAGDELAQFLDDATDPDVLVSAVVNWRELDDAEAREVWVGLRAWVEWLAGRYVLSASVIPACWWKHGGLVEELSTLRTAHSVFFAPEDDGRGPLEWHERFANAIERMKKATAARAPTRRAPCGACRRTPTRRRGNGGSRPRIVRRRRLASVGRSDSAGRAQGAFPK